MAQLNCTDFLNISSLLTEEEIQVQHAARDFTEKEILPIIIKHHREATFPKEILPKMGSLGFLGATLPQEYGCAGLNNVAYGLLMQELERGDSSMRSAASVQGGLVMYPIFTYGSEEQKKKWLPKLASGKAIGCFGLTEPDFGSNPAGMLTKAKKKNPSASGHGGKWILNGAKMWITNGTIADVAVVWAKNEAGKINGFLVEKGAKGFSAPETKGKFSLRASVTSELVLEDVEVPEENRLPKAEGLKAPLNCLTQARYGIAWGALGLAMACYEAAVEYSKTRIQFDKPIGAFQLTQKKLAEMLTEITKGQLLALQLGRLKDSGKMRPEQVSMCKMNNCAIARHITHLAREILGANGILDEYPVIRHMMNIESVYTYEGTHEIHTLVLGEDITGIPAYK
ncbi:MAG: acyl-CoA dehydrogenase [Deltaproteobacteria bacterium RIFCSPLOWO2_01_44_7]|nr:MAG: acyl-CoA dehydrogenase [Deltaproteobacteria bacterium RIFCSPHIGHO2_01_FULL_43_49]OGQ15152.1 MAG: acyl-CoA dehydrogenase [Deltaproteobacteria bacterium RIFCSPHIGHO2_02_FULL_44_53]OGQ27227.1 MAG: acyl-CoA dehydrogenase [Deltaproteobacteria bacterium RIFCSPHIGHO2_12_FULL_44_21]OGQ31669.1 MAG: acyl-CoA dehydrogenase [Deltaproteobacteria bacterium RIFCSPLOWO2_01_FULL_45_74]OGQ38809.1 MAG: acyl-CoA dehydrogenase [Deltaproteobacteria bacterium RIFCSPLOWO2_01_44_7]OGQ42869.1 MAG: acyl-CoA dehy